MTDKTISDREAEFLRKKIAFINSHDGYRTVMTDAESPCGILPRCTSPDHPAEDTEQQDVLDCCETHPLIETWHEHLASVWVDSLTVIPALLDERDRLRARVAELQQPAVEPDEDDLGSALARINATLERHAARGTHGGEYLDDDIRSILKGRMLWKSATNAKTADLAARDERES